MRAIANDWVFPRSLAFLIFVLVALQVTTAKAQLLVPESVSIPAGAYVSGSDAAEREFGYRLDENAYGHSVTRKQGWYDSEVTRGQRKLPAFRITRNLITNKQYAQFIAATGQAAPDVDPQTWAGYRLIHPYSRTRRHAWHNNVPPEGREQHPVVLVSHNQALAYAHWLSESTGQKWTLPTEAQWEKAARGEDGRRFPWGDEWRPELLNSHDAGSFDTLVVGTYREGASPFGVLDMAGQVFEWTRTRSGPGRFIVKGGSWDDKGCGVCRSAARHSRPQAIKHILIGFRLVTE